ncbi:hypothetical protein EI42_05742 [Thermosporothrix hazakensis]|jgi:hypothetical protein|uniref:Uncharacterized protein n=1 Tax=Thermosporothrix hazakensis TaxID=644383 RepID=A0A326TV70_THEHA|nr:hypothetical protein [Thermosporothrix hazakensis]PZW20981.1 hypothetical protein EI42_05742 [Thermosporothrix hazakensis]GCE49264.1 hypothetical protein KTH_41330 [Thermosporothrix hazakensis]
MITFFPPQRTSIHILSWCEQCAIYADETHAWLRHDGQVPFVKTTIWVPDPEGWEVLHGREYYGSGLGYWRAEQPWKPWRNGFVYREAPHYIITHLASGSRMPFTCYTEKHARAMIAEMAKLVDWNRSLIDLTSDPAWKQIITQCAAIYRQVVEKEEGAPHACAR